MVLKMPPMISKKEDTRSERPWRTPIVDKLELVWEVIDLLGG